MSSLTETASWFVQGFLGRIPVFAPGGVQVGYRKNYTDTYFVLDPQFVATNGARLTTKTIKGFDDTITVTGKTVNGNVTLVTFVSDNTVANSPSTAIAMGNIPPLYLAAGAAGLVTLILLLK